MIVLAIDQNFSVRTGRPAECLDLPGAVDRGANLSALLLPFLENFVF